MPRLATLKRLSLVVAACLALSACSPVAPETTAPAATPEPDITEAAVHVTVPPHYTAWPLSDIGCTLHLPVSLDIFTAGMNESDPLLAEYGIAASDLDSYLDAIHCSLIAMEPEGQVEIYFGMMTDAYTEDYDDLVTLDEETFNALAQGFAFSFGQPVVYQTDTYKFMLFEYKAEVQDYGEVAFVRYKTVKHGKFWNLYAMRKTGAFTDAEKETLRMVASTLEVE